MSNYYNDGYIELNPNLNDSYDPETGEEIYIPSNYPFDIPKVYIEGNLGECVDGDSIVTVRDNIVIRYTYFDNCGSEFRIEEYNIDTLEKKEYWCYRSIFSSSMNLRDYYCILDYIDPEVIKKFNIGKDTKTI